MLARLKSSRLVIYFDLSRGIQSPLSLTQPLLGAVLAQGGIPSLRVLTLGIIAAGAGYFSVFALNDLLDREIDTKSIGAGKAKRDKHDIGVTVNKHPLARGDVSLPAAIAWVGSMALIGAIFAYILNPVCFYLFLGCIVLETLYCSLRSLSWLKTIPTGIMVATGGLAGWSAVAPVDWRSAGFFLFLALWEIAGRNLANDLADVESDRLMGLKTVATIFGSRVSAIAILIGAFMTLTAVTALPVSMFVKVIALLVGLWSMGVPAIKLAMTPSSIQASSYFNKASLMPLLVLLVLMPFLLFNGWH